MLAHGRTLLQYTCLYLVLLRDHTHSIEEEDWNELTFVMLTLKCIYKKLASYVKNKPCLTTPISVDKLRRVSQASVRYQNIAKKFNCPECNLTVSAFIALWRHMRTKHNLDIGSSVSRRLYTSPINHES